MILEQMSTSIFTKPALLPGTTPNRGTDPQSKAKYRKLPEITGNYRDMGFFSRSQCQNDREWHRRKGGTNSAFYGQVPETTGNYRKFAPEITGIWGFFHPRNVPTTVNGTAARGGANSPFYVQVPETTGNYRDMGFFHGRPKVIASLERSRSRKAMAGPAWLAIS